MGTITEVSPFSNFYVLSYTFADDAAHRIENNPRVVLSSGNICCYTNDCKVGNALNLPAIIRANAVVWFDSPFRPFDLLFQNNVAGSNATVVIYGPLKEK